MISGDYYHGKHHQPPRSYFFSRCIGTWGWASWARAWKFNDRTMRHWPEIRNSDWLMRVGDGHKDFRDFWTEVFDTVHAGRIDIWDYQWAYSCWLLDGITILPSRNLVKYIGYGGEATHTQGDGGWIGKLPLETMSFPLVHPAEIKRDRSGRSLDRPERIWGGSEKLSEDPAQSSRHALGCSSVAKIAVVVVKSTR